MKTISKERAKERAKGRAENSGRSVKEVGAKYSIISLDRIDFRDRRYAVSFDPDPADLSDSIASHGILNPVRLLGVDDRYVPIAGWRRLVAAQKLRLESVPALVYGGDLNDSEAVRLSLLDNFPTREYTAVEASGVVSRLIDDFGIGEEEVIGEFFDLLHLPRSKKILGDLLSVNGLSDKIKALCHKRRYPLKALCRWRGFDEDDRSGLFRLISTAHVGSGVVLELLGAISDIIKRDRITVGELLEESALKSILGDEKVTSGGRGESVRERIRRIRYPIHTDLTEKFNDTLKKLKLPKGAEISHHPHFEADTLNLTFRFRDGRDLTRLGEFLTMNLESEEMKQLLDTV